MRRLRPSADGVVVQYTAWGDSTCATSTLNNGGATATHEVGHYLGLAHTFQDYGDGVGGASGQCGVSSEPLCHQSGDLICDTAPELDPIFDCVSVGSCSTTDPVENFMDYS